MIYILDIICLLYHHVMILQASGMDLNNLNNIDAGCIIFIANRTKDRQRPKTSFGMVFEKRGEQTTRLLETLSKRV